MRDCCDDGRRRTRARANTRSGSLADARGIVFRSRISHAVSLSLSRREEGISELRAKVRCERTEERSDVLWKHSVSPFVAAKSARRMLYRSVSTLQLCGRSVLGRPSATVVLSKPDILRARLNNFPRKKGEPRNWLLTASTGRVARYEMKVNCVIDPDTIISIVPNATRYVPKSRIPGIPGARQFFFHALRATRLRRESRVSSRYRSAYLSKDSH